MAVTSSVTTGDCAWHFVPIGAAATKAQRHVLKTLPCLIGRGQNLSLYLPSPHVSKLHAVVFEKGGELFVRDNGSTNGTYVNGAIVAGERLLKNDDLIQFADVPFRLTRETMSLSKTVGSDACDIALAVAQFDRLLHDDGVLVPHFQPIVSASGSKVVAYEVLGRSRLYGLSKPHTMFSTAAQLGMEVQLSQRLRRCGYLVGGASTSSTHVFLNTHPREIEDIESLLASLSELRKLEDGKAVTVEIHESGATDAKSMRVMRKGLQELGMRLAYDDFGAGQSRLAELASVPPDCVKFDMTLIRGIHRASAKKQEMLETLVRMTTELGAAPLAEGVECEDEAGVCRQLGFELFQGFHFGRPKKAAEYVAPRQPVSRDEKPRPSTPIRGCGER